MSAVLQRCGNRQQGGGEIIEPVRCMILYDCNYSTNALISQKQSLSLHEENLTLLSAMKRLKANADKMLWITYITVFERMAAYCLHDKETCASRHSSVKSERRDAGFENKKSFQKKVSKYQPFVFIS